MHFGGLVVYCGKQRTTGRERGRTDGLRHRGLNLSGF